MRRVGHRRLDLSGALPPAPSRGIDAALTSLPTAEGPADSVPRGPSLCSATGADYASRTFFTCASTISAGTPNFFGLSRLIE